MNLSDYGTQAPLSTAPTDPRFRNALGPNITGPVPMAAPASGPAPAPGVPAPATPMRTQAPPLQAAPQPQAAPMPQPQAQTPVAGVTLPNGQWVPSNHPLAPSGSASGAAGGGAAPASPGASMTDAFRSALTQRLTANPIPTSIADDPVLAAQSGAMRQASARQAARDRSTGIEAAGATGLESSGAASGMVRKLGQDRAFNEGQADAKLLGDARSQRMGELFQALGLAGNYDVADRGLAEQTAGRIAGQDIQRQGLSAQTSLGNADLALRDRQGTRGQDLQLMDLLMGDRYRNSALGLNAGIAEAGLNTQALLGLMGMGG
jgi:hypothetical protein